MDGYTVKTVRIRIWWDGTIMLVDIGVLPLHESFVIIQFKDADIHVCGTDPSCRSATASLETLRSEGVRMNAMYASGFINTLLKCVARSCSRHCFMHAFKFVLCGPGHALS